MGVQLSVKAALPLTGILVTASDRCSKTGPRGGNILVERGQYHGSLPRHVVWSSALLYLSCRINQFVSWEYVNCRRPIFFPNVRFIRIIKWPVSILMCISEYPPRWISARFTLNTFLKPTEEHGFQIEVTCCIPLKIALDFSESPIESQWVSRKNPGQLESSDGEHTSQVTLNIFDREPHIQGNLRALMVSIPVKLPWIFPGALPEISRVTWELWWWAYLSSYPGYFRGSMGLPVISRVTSQVWGWGWVHQMCYI